LLSEPSPAGEHSERPASPDAKRKSLEKGRRTGQVRTGCFALRNSSAPSYLSTLNIGCVVYVHCADGENHVRTYLFASQVWKGVP
uniref:Uncharacterized protein n=1 Tax=Corvus moneduloides TaxID=1196302 RepID=A0A8C3EQ28_CORMO